MTLCRGHHLPLRIDVALMLHFHLFLEVTECIEFHRVVQDESHLFKGGPSASKKNANLISSPRRWCVTATPAGDSSQDILPQLEFINGSAHQSRIDPLYSATIAFGNRPSQTSFNHLVDSLQICMVRHTKSQRINGEFHRFFVVHVLLSNIGN